MKRGNLRRPIPEHIRAQLDADPEYHRCALSGIGYCDGRIQWHHYLKVAGRRTDDPEGIIALCEHHHDKESLHKADLDRILMSRVTPELRAKYPRAIWPRT